MISAKLLPEILVAVLVAAVAAPAAAGADTGHPYRHGEVPTLSASPAHAGRAATPLRAATRALTPSSGNLVYGGGQTGAGYPAGVGVTTGAPKVYLVFWGSQWGTAGTNGNGDTTLAGDPDGMAPRLQEFFKGLGAGGELWSGVMTQYCEGVPPNTQFCPNDATARVGYPTGGALAGVWTDESVAAPAQATGTQIGEEAVAARDHFGATTAAQNRNAQYVVVSPTGTNPDGFNTATSTFCAWHGYTGDGLGLSTSVDVAFTNLPYIPDAGGTCGENFVNRDAAGTLDGVTIIAGHEYAETLTDQFPAGGYLDSGGDENGDKCAWISSGQGAVQDYPFGTGSFAVQSTWANDFNGGAGGCEISHPIMTSTPDFSLQSSPGTAQHVNPGGSASYGVTVNDLRAFSGDVTLSAATPASGLPIGATASFSPNPTSSTSTMTIDTTSAVPPGSYSVTVTGTSGALTHATVVQFVVDQPDFSLTATPATESVSQGGSTSYAVSITPLNGLLSAVDLSVSGLPAGAGGTFSPTPATSVSTLSVSTSASTPSGSHTLTISATSGSLTRTVNVALIVTDISSGPAPSSGPASGATPAGGGPSSDSPIGSPLPASVIAATSSSTGGSSPTTTSTPGTSPPKLTYHRKKKHVKKRRRIRRRPSKAHRRAVARHSAAHLRL